MKKARRILAIVVALVMALSMLPMAFAGNDDAQSMKDKLTSSEQSNSNKLEKKLTKTFENKSVDLGLDDDALVRAIIVFDDAPLSDTYSADAIRNNEAVAVQTRLTDAHDTFFKSLTFEAQRNFDYTVLLNGIAIETAYKNVAALKTMDGVKDVFIASTYSAPKVEKPTMEYANAMTYANYMQNINYDGKGMVIAVLDTGLNLGHEAFQDYNITTETPRLTEEFVASVNTNVNGKYVSDKIPFAYDYYDYDDDVTDYNGHGSHVSGTIAGYAKAADGAVTFSGVAPAAQIVFMKIFADAGGGTSSDVYFAALEDCYILGVDALNMSIGSDSGFTWDPELENEYFGNIFDRLENAGIVACISAGNDDSLGSNSMNWSDSFYGEKWVTSDVSDFGVVGSPSTYDGNISVASVENTAYPAYALSAMIGGEETMLAFNDSSEADDPMHWMTVMANMTYEFVNCGKGDVSDFESVDPTGKIALIQRGTITFEEKIENAYNAGAIAAVIYNNQAGTIGMSIETFEIPAVSITQADGENLLANSDDQMITTPTGMTVFANEKAYTISDFSSRGVTPELTLKPTITGPGGMIYSAVAGASDAYEVYSGTSMASPNVTGNMALILQYLKEEHPEMSKIQRANMAEDMATSNAMLLPDFSYAGDGFYAYESPRKQGAGLIYTPQAVYSDLYIVDSVASLGDYSAEVLANGISFKITLGNKGADAITIDTDDITSALTYDYANTTQYNTYNTTLPENMDEGTDYLLVFADDTIVVPANGTIEVSAMLMVSPSLLGDFADDYPNGNFIDGYITFPSDDVATILRPTSLLAGDVNMDGIVSATDVSLLLRSLVGSDELVDDQVAAGDLDGIAGVTAADAALIMRYVIGLIGELPNVTVEAELPIGMMPVTHYTFTLFNGDWTQAPVLETYNSFDYLDGCNYMQTNGYGIYLDYGYTPFDLMIEANIGMNEAYAYSQTRNKVVSYLGDNPMYDYTAMSYFNSAISNEKSSCGFYLSDLMLSYPTQLRNARHLIMTISDMATGEVYYVDDTEYLGRAYYSSDYGQYMQQGSFYWDGINYNEESAGYGDYLPSGTWVLVTYETMVDYDGATLNEEWQFPLIIDSTAPTAWIESVDETTGDITIGVSDNHKLASVEISYTALTADEEPEEYTEYVAMEAPDYTTTEDGNFYYTITAAQFAAAEEIDGYVYIDLLDYATNWPDFALIYNNGQYHIMDNFEDIPEYAYSIENARETIASGYYDTSTVFPLLGTVIAIDDDIVYMQTYYPKMFSTDRYFGIAVHIPAEMNEGDFGVGDTIVAFGYLDEQHGLPIMEALDYSVYATCDSYDDELWYLNNVTITSLFDFKDNYLCSLVWMEDLTITDILPQADGTFVYTVSDGFQTIDIVNCGELGDPIYDEESNITGVTDPAVVGDIVYGMFVVTMDAGVMQLQPLNTYDYCGFDTAN